MSEASGALRASASRRRSASGVTGAVKDLATSGV